MSQLFSSLSIGDLVLPNRIVMAPLTRCRADVGRVPNALMAEYYAQRASAGLILSEATAVTPTGCGYPDTPGLWSDAQIEGWKGVTSAVHAKGGRIFAQLWHVGRISDPVHLHGELPVAPSAVRPAGHPSLLRPMREFVTPRALDTAEIPGIIAAYTTGARNALDAGFDGVELHAANGYLIEQFLATKTNHRTDAYGGSIANRMRFLLEIADAVAAEVGEGRVGVHLSPRCDSNDSGTDDAMELYPAVARELGRRKLAFVFTRESEGPDSLTPILRQEFGGPVIANEKFTPETAEAAIAEGRADAVAWGKAFISNPDLVARIKAGAPLAELDMATIYGVGGLGPKGYTDYPAMG
ncbi:MAG: alkene reductase [Phyllobacteriaceae bacterium]|nr:alkene reductase [Phyllobacteriaceae bacterium]